MQHERHKTWETKPGFASHSCVTFWMSLSKSFTSSGLTCLYQHWSLWELKGTAGKSAPKKCLTHHRYSIDSVYSFTTVFPQQVKLLITWFALIFIGWLQSFEETKKEGCILFISRFICSQPLFLPPIFVLKYEKQHGIVAKVKNLRQKDLCLNPVYKLGMEGKLVICSTTPLHVHCIECLYLSYISQRCETLRMGLLTLWPFLPHWELAGLLKEWEQKTRIQDWEVGVTLSDLRQNLLFSSEKRVVQTKSRERQKGNSCLCFDSHQLNTLLTWRIPLKSRNTSFPETHFHGIITFLVFSLPPNRGLSWLHIFLQFTRKLKISPWNKSVNKTHLRCIKVTMRLILPAYLIFKEVLFE